MTPPKLKDAWRVVRAKMTDMGDGDLHGDDHDDVDCPICAAIREMDREVRAANVTSAVKPR